jgi:hypothetical protein
MKTFALALISSIVLLTTSANAQDTSQSQPDSYFGVSAFISLLPLPLNLSVDVLKFSEKAYNGVTFGLTTFPLQKNSYPDYGGHITYTRLALKRKGYFETKIGLAYNRNFADYYLDTNFLPVISIGYRFQKVDSNWFFRVALSTGLIGIGFGVNLN